MKKIVTAIMLTAVTIAGLSVSAPASGVLSPEAEAEDAKSRAAELNLDVRPIIDGCRATNGYPQLHFNRCVARQINIFIAQRTTTPVSTANTGVSVEGEVSYSNTIQEAIDAEEQEGEVHPNSVRWCLGTNETENTSSLTTP